MEKWDEGLTVGDLMTHLVVMLRDRRKPSKKPRSGCPQTGSVGRPVVDQGRLIGLESVPDLVQAYAPASRTLTRPSC
jgi:hypothetical protein